jgi:hypothetical protein
MLIVKVLYLLFFCLIVECYGQTDKLLAINFLSARTIFYKIKNSTIELQPKRTSSTSRDHSICLRVKFLSWNTNQLISSKTIKLFLEKINNFKAQLVIGAFMHRFSWENSMEISHPTWNSICILHSTMNFSVSLFINGKQVHTIPL